jgi:asparagine synthase (glutamine-hydrolysing)
MHQHVEARVAIASRRDRPHEARPRRARPSIWSTVAPHDARVDRLVCGICGFVGGDDVALIEAMTALLEHRGPDGAGVKVFTADDGSVPAALGHRRLSIIDPTPRGDQPMSYANGRYWITYNGEIYNYRELRSELEADGFGFESECDTEVLLAAYARDGEGMLNEVNGIFAFAIWDAEAEELFLARDRLGVKPLHYAIHDGVLYFASEIKSLLAAIPSPALSSESLAAYLTFLWVPEPETLFEGIHKLPAGFCARYAEGRLRTRQYWDLRFRTAEPRSIDGWANTVGETVEEAVRRQMVSDVPLGAFLSGGIDSGAIVRTMTLAATEPVDAYTVGFAGEDLAYEIVPDDLKYARLLARELGVEHHERVLRPEIVDLLPRLIWHMDEPIADPAAITTYLICSAARERMTVILSGMGGDEVFAGYPRHLAARMTRPLELLPAGARRGAKRLVESRLTVGGPGRLRGPRRNLLKLVRGLEQRPVERYLTYSSYYRAEELSQLLVPSVREVIGGYDPFQRHVLHAERVANEHWLNQLLYVDMKTFLPCLNLAYTDKMSMAASTEVRVPLLDDEVVATAAAIPAELKLRRATRKYILKQSLRGALPDRVIDRPKAGFGAPIRSWLVGDLRPLVHDLLSPEAVTARGLFEPRAVERLVHQEEAGIADNALRIWALLCLELWSREVVSPADRTASRQTVGTAAQPGRS